MSNNETKREYPRLENGVVLYGPQDEPKPAAQKAEPKKAKAADSKKAK